MVVVPGCVHANSLVLENKNNAREPLSPARKRKRSGSPAGEQPLENIRSYQRRVSFRQRSRSKFVDVLHVSSQQYMAVST